MKKFLPLLLVVINLISPLKAADQSVQSTINRMANELTATYRSKSPNAKRARLAILDLQASEDLNKQRISPALIDMITNEFVNKSDFIVLERELFGKIMEEHQLLANFGDVSNAIKVGKVLGAEVVLLGSVTQFKSDLRINLRLVNTETTEILSTTSGMVAISEFSKENPTMQGFMPITQKIGLFAVASHRFAGHSDTPIDWNYVEGTITWYYTANIPDFSFDEIGAGIRYFPSKNIFFEASFAQIQKISMDTRSTSYSNQPPFGIIPGYSGTPSAKGSSWRFAAGSQHKFNTKFSTNIFAGMHNQKLTIESGVFRLGSAINKWVPYIGGGAAYDFQNRLSVSFDADWDLIGLATKANETGQTVYTLNPLTITPKISFYF